MMMPRKSGRKNNSSPKDLLALAALLATVLLATLFNIKTHQDASASRDYGPAQIDQLKTRLAEASHH